MVKITWNCECSFTSVQLKLYIFKFKLIDIKDSFKILIKWCLYGCLYNVNALIVPNNAYNDGKDAFSQWI